MEASVKKVRKVKQKSLQIITVIYEPGAFLLGESKQNGRFKLYIQKTLVYGNYLEKFRREVMPKYHLICVLDAFRR